MDATVLLVTLLFCQSGLCQSGYALDLPAGEPIADTPAVQNQFIEVDLTEPARITTVPETDTAVTPAVTPNVDPLPVDNNARAEAVTKDADDPLDHIEPLFVEDVESEMDTAADVEMAPVETVPVESAPVETAPVARVVEGPQLLNEPAKESDATQPAPLEEMDDQAATGEKAIVPNLNLTQPVATSENAVNDASVGNAQAETIEGNAESLDAIAPIVLDDLTEDSEPQADAVELPVEEDTTKADSPFVQPLPLIEPDFVPGARSATQPKPEKVEETTISPIIENTEPDSEPTQEPVPPTRENAPADVSTPSEYSNSNSAFDLD